MMSTLQRLCNDAFQKYLARIVLRIDETEEKLSYSEAEELIVIIEKRLTLENVHQGDRICSISPLNLESILLAWACFRLGIIFVPIDHSWSKDLINYAIQEVSPKLVFTSSQIYLSEVFQTITYDECSECNTFIDWLHKTEIRDIIPDMRNLTDADEAIILYTSGSTGYPKGVVLSHGALFRSGKLVTELFEWQSEDIFLNLGDLHSMSGFRNTCIAPLHVGCSAIIANEKSRSTALMLPEMIKRNNCTLIGVAPIVISQFNLSANRFDSDTFREVRAILCTGSFLDPKQIKLFYENFSCPILNYYGLTETSGLCSGHSFKTFDTEEISIGLEVGATLQIVDEKNNPVPDGTSGFLRVKSKNLMKGYFKKPTLTQQVLKNKWYYTGDIALKRSDGHIILKGRSRNIIKNAYSDLIHLEEVEMCLERHPIISEACICSYSTKYNEERMAAFIVLREGSDIENKNTVINKIKSFIESNIGFKKNPHKFIFVKKLKRNKNGKVLRNKHKESLENDFKSK